MFELFAQLKPRCLEAATAIQVQHLDFAIELILADVTTAFRLWMKAKPVGGLSEIGKDPPQIRPIREPAVATVSGEWAGMATRCDRVELF